MSRRPGSRVGRLFVANAAFNNLGFPTWSTVFNWGRATVGTVPFVWIGATQFGADGVIAGQALGAVVFGIGAVIVASDGRTARRTPDRPRTSKRSPTAAADPAFSSGKAATAIDWADPEERSKLK